MTHFVLIDAHSGFVWGEADALDPISACEIVDREVGGDARKYEAVSRLDGVTGYYVYKAPADWKPVDNGQDNEEIKRVIALPLCEKVRFETIVD